MVAEADHLGPCVVKSLQWLDALCFLLFLWVCFHAGPIMAFLDRLLAS